MSRVAVVGSFDSKLEPLTILVDEIHALGGEALTIDTSVFPTTGIYAVSADVVAESAGYDHSTLASAGRAVAVHAMAEGAASILRQLCADGSVGAVVCMGGSNAATVFSHITTAVPIGLPKFLMSTVVAGNTRPMINATDAVMLYPIVDIEGSGDVVRAMGRRLARLAVASTDEQAVDLAKSKEQRVGLTMFGVTTPCVARCRSAIETQGLDPFVVHANGAGGTSLERFISESQISSVLDISTTEIADELFGGLFGAGPERLKSAAQMGLPQVVSAGALDMINFGPLESVPDKYHDRHLLPHNDLVTLMRTTPAENKILGETIAERLDAPSAPTTFVIPTRGVSEMDKKGSPFYDPNAMDAFIGGLRNRASPAVRIVEADMHINDPAFSDLLVEELLAVRST